MSDTTTPPHDEPRIILTETPRYVDASRWDTPLCVYPRNDNHGGILGCDSVSLDEYERRPQELSDEYDTVIFLEITLMKNTSTRCDDIWDFVYYQMDTPKISVDRFLFRSDPWRTWFNFGLVDAKYRDYTLSYLAETDYDKWFNQYNDDNPFSLEEIVKWGDGLIECQYPQYFRSFDVTVGYETNEVERQNYSELLDELFQSENTIGQVRRGLESYADDLYPDRDVPSRHQLFRNERREWEAHITDLPIDAWETGYLRYLVDLTNDIAATFHPAQDDDQTKTTSANPEVSADAN